MPQSQIRCYGTVQGTALGAISEPLPQQERAGQIVAAVNDKSGETGVFAYINSASKIVLQSETLTAAISLGGEVAATMGLGPAASASNTTSGKVSGLSVEHVWRLLKLRSLLVDDALKHD